jgi:hypothetical protein
MRTEINVFKADVKGSVGNVRKAFASALKMKQPKGVSLFIKQNQRAADVLF